MSNSSPLFSVKPGLPRSSISNLRLTAGATNTYAGVENDSVCFLAFPHHKKDQKERAEVDEAEAAVLEGICRRAEEKIHQFEENGNEQLLSSAVDDLLEILKVPPPPLVFFFFVGSSDYTCASVINSL